MFNWYEIRVKGHLEPGRLDWFEGLQIQNLENGETSLISLITDRLVLRGVLDKLRDLGLTLLSLHRIEAEEAIFLLMRSKAYYSMIVKRNNQLQILFGMRNTTKCTRSLCVDLMGKEITTTNLIDLKEGKTPVNEILSFFILTLGITDAIGLPIAAASQGRLLYLHCLARILDLQQNQRANRLARIHPAALAFRVYLFPRLPRLS